MKPIIISSSEIWIGTEILPIPERYRQLLEGLLRVADVRVCSDADAHRESYIYVGNGQFVCGYCRQLLKEVC